MDSQQTHGASIDAALIGKRIVKAGSSLKLFCVAFADGTGLRVDAVLDGDEPLVQISMPSAEDLPLAKEAVCAVDWSWIYDNEIKAVKSTDSFIKLQLDQAGPLSVSVSLWQRAPFLAFQPFKPDKPQ